MPREIERQGLGTWGHSLFLILRCATETLGVGEGRCDWLEIQGHVLGERDGRLEAEENVCLVTVCFAM